MHFFRAGVLALALSSVPALAIEPFVIKDIRVEGIQRTEAGTVFSYLPVKVGDTMTDEKASQTVRALFATGFFRDVSLEAEEGVLVVVGPSNIRDIASGLLLKLHPTAPPSRPRGTYSEVPLWK